MFNPTIKAMSRKAIEQLYRWKASADRKPLVVQGARQVCKTWLMQEFAKEAYKKCAYVNFEDNDMLRHLFDNDFDIERILSSLSWATGVDIDTDTLIILDEIQEASRGITSLKYFREKAPQYHVMAAGSLLGIAMHRHDSFPVGKVDFMTLYPLSFFEFLDAVGEGRMVDLLRKGDWPMVTMFRSQYEDRLRQYYYVGGMPGVVSAFVASGSMEEVRTVQKGILESYERDFSKHAPATEVPRIRMVWKSIPSQLFKENKKFIYGALRKGARAIDFEIAIQWLADAGLVYKVPRCKKLELPLGIYEDFSAFKLYLSDVGLLGAMVNVEPAQILINNDIFSEYKGGMTEQYVLQQMISRNETPIYYYKTDNSRLELDFVIQKEGKLLPIEVKAEGNVRANSLSRMLKENPKQTALRYSMLPYKEQEQLTNVPLYLV